ncbi:hypothetical protein CP985_03260 [Malaciobacter mytili LMG 24559]|uniref:Uncharacterized protein n=1 Tax=Malaciobacter mytili LMG 24559 TaxID=1032238 RepID=A0AAX2AHH0_9BACT|nr:hypothetical protein [Malaciobacter mytili]AXH16378.1 hypothetical protein AMYT_a0078 [Malaciobacter mytili LMG 24559]RXK16442.1 hypothetical protein CP985_03260 [Malaciobacter mytili LMG 24559]
MFKNFRNEIQEKINTYSLEELEKKGEEVIGLKESNFFDAKINFLFANSKILKKNIRVFLIILIIYVITISFLTVQIISLLSVQMFGLFFNVRVNLSSITNCLY